MANDNEVKFVLDLDVKEFTESGLKAKGIIEGLGSSENLTGLLEGLTQAGLALGVVGAAAYAFKEALDLTLEGEQIQRVQKQFDTLSAAAGLSSKELKEGLESASGGLIDTTDLLETANKALVAMGGSAEKLPEIMELARKATAVFGGDLKSNFDNITTAIQNGNSRMLKHYGIIVDTEKAVRDYAAANNLASNELSEAGKRQAIMNAALDQGKKAFAGVDEDMGSATNTLQLLKVTIKDLGEVFTLAFEKTIGPTIRKGLVALKDFAHTAKVSFTAAFGDGLDQSNAKLEETQGHIKDIQAELDKLEKKKGSILDFAPAETLSRITALKSSLSSYQAQLSEIQRQNEQMSEEEKKNDQQRKQTVDQRTTESKVNQAAHLENEKKFQEELGKIKKDRLAADALNVQSMEEIERNIKVRQQQEEKQNQDKIKSIQNSTYLNVQQKEQLIAQQKTLFSAQEKQQQQQDAAFRKQQLDNYVKNSTGAFSAISKSFKANSLANKAELSNFGRLGQETFASFQSNSVAAFQEMGRSMAQGVDIATAAATAIRNVFLNMIADRAIQEGTLLLLSSIYPPNPLGIVGGAALIAFGGALKGVTGGGGSTTNTPSATVSSPPVLGAGDTAAPASNVAAQQDNSTSSNAPNMAAMSSTPQKVVNVNIAGNYMDSDASRRQMLEMIRQETDATDFSYNKIGV